MSILSIHNVSKSFAGKSALHNASLEVKAGSIYGLLGPNGAGKTTLIRIINQIFAADSGDILFDGHQINESDLRRIGYLPEERGLYRKMKMSEQLLYFAQLKGMKIKDAENAMQYWFKETDITNWHSKKIEELSKGMQQKVQFVSTILHNPDLIILDEPFSGFDPVNADLIKNILLNLKREGKTIVLSTHNMSSVEELCDEISLINASEIVLQGRVDDIRYARKLNVIEIDFEGNIDEVLNFLRCTHALLSEIVNINSAKVQIMLTKDSNVNDLLSEIMKRTHLKLYRELLPTMNDIFISTVKNTHQNV